MLLAWTYPSMTAAGTRLDRLERVIVYRYVEGLPPSLAGRDPRSPASGMVETSEPAEIALFTQVPPLPPQQFTRLKEEIASLDATQLADVTEGTRIIYQDDPPKRTDDGRPVRLAYAVATEARGGLSDLSNVVTIVPLDPAVPPDPLTARATPEAVILEWTKPATSLGGADQPAIIGYNVYRAAADAPDIPLDQPLNPGPLPGTSYNDTPPWGAHRYVVTAVARIGPPLVQSDPTQPVTAEYRDLLPPPPPTSLVTLLEQQAVRLVWEPVQAPDLAGYKVYRSVEGRTSLLSTQIVVETNYVDRTGEPGMTYTYSVTSVDARGNESGGTIAPAVLIPR